MIKSENFFRNKKVLVTGHTGFKGSWLTLWLLKLGANVCGISLEPRTKKDNFILCRLENEIEHHIRDIRELDKLKDIFTRFAPDIVFHLAALPIVRESYRHPLETFQTNVMGTVNLLECCRRHPGKMIIIVVTSDKCYEIRDIKRGYREDDSLGGYDPYSSSKGAAEIIAHSYQRSFFSDNDNPYGKCLATGRAGNVIGGGDWQVDRLIPDCIRAFERNTPVIIRNPHAVRPWQHVLEPISGYMQLAYHLFYEPNLFAGAWNFGPDPHDLKNVEEVVTAAVDLYGSGHLQIEDQKTTPHETGILMLDNTKAKKRLKWKPVWNFQTALYETIDWYKYYADKDMRHLCETQIDRYIKSTDGSVNEQELNNA